MTEIKQKDVKKVYETISESTTSAKSCKTCINYRPFMGEVWGLCGLYKIVGGVKSGFISVNESKACDKMEGING